MAGLPSSKVSDFLISKGIDHIYHANSVATACYFLREHSLLSRGIVERLGLQQTPQSSDSADKKYSIWFDVFTDSVDIHARVGSYNIYGPVTFVIDVGLIKETYTGQIWITKLNPIKWAGKTTKQRWFQNMDDLQDNFGVGTFDHMIVFRHNGGELPLRKYLNRIILDDPEIVKRGIEYYSAAYGALVASMDDMMITIERRKCKEGCKCRRHYNLDRVRTAIMYAPKYKGE